MRVHEPGVMRQQEEIRVAEPGEIVKTMTREHECGAAIPLGFERGREPERGIRIERLPGLVEHNQAKWLAPEGLNVYDVLNPPRLILTQASARAVEQALRQ